MARERVVDPPKSIERALRAMIADQSYSCVGAKSALNRQAMQIEVLGALGSARTTSALYEVLRAYLARYGDGADSETLRTLVTCFRGPRKLSEPAFERALWAQLQALHDRDAPRHGWADEVSADPDDANFAYSFGGVPFFVVGLHPSASRPARRFGWPAIAWNFHRQFERLRAEGHYARMRDVIRAREVKCHGSLNPELRDHGVDSQARQYSGCPHAGSWSAPFVAAPLKAERAAS